VNYFDKNADLRQSNAHNLTEARHAIGRAFQSGESLYGERARLDLTNELDIVLSISSGHSRSSRDLSATSLADEKQSR
jgi:hypothetical protein